MAKKKKRRKPRQQSSQRRGKYHSSSTWSKWVRWFMRDHDKSDAQELADYILDAYGPEEAGSLLRSVKKGVG